MNKKHFGGGVMPLEAALVLYNDNGLNREELNGVGFFVFLASNNISD